VLTELDPRVAAQVNLDSVLGALPMLAATVPEAGNLLTRLRRETTVRIRVRGGPGTDLTFDRAGVRPGGGGAPVGLLLTSCAHLNRMIAGTARPVPVAGPGGLRFLAGVLTPLTEILGRYLEPTPQDLRDPLFAERSTRLTLAVVLSAVTVVANTDRSGRVSAAAMPEGRIDVEVGADLREHLQVREHRLARVTEAQGPPRALLRFEDLATVEAVFSGRASAVAEVSAGRMSIRGMIPMVDNLNRILDRAAHYLRK